ncbi:3-keto-5-aminohexanoate cleavage protein [Phenylobacterium sp. SCN 70-31]|uniref:3-keto-5-aminohexanoate cleavage protein n=1 Tax=Phenylobacterium sp. SCN 70-31 TaxID=1660129 RepID=UPI00086D4A54|nr:3-keto-5-aminohexanoate cleavage protein [Phenylobacterium sp. SCN 70-31]ODT89948.1 MAG: NADPH:quinone reductase [Phenylobacterium sp. SCN 70-31]
MRDIVLTCAITGNITRPEQTPHLPITPQQVAESALEAAEAGASVAHIHVRHPDGRPSMETEHYAEVVERIRARNRDLILNLTTGPGGRYIPDPDNPRLAAPGTSLLPPLERIPHIQALPPEVCTLDLNTMNSGDQVVMNTPRNTRIMAEAMLDGGWRPEIEIFNPGDLVLARDLMARATFPSPPLFSFVLGVKYGWPASLESIQLGRSLLPEDAVWTAFGVGPSEFPMVGLSVLLGGHARVGLEDNIYLEKGVLARSNAELCERATRIIRDLGFRVASPTRAREIFGLAPAMAA